MENGQGQIYTCKATSGMSNIIGNVSLIIRDYIKDIFPKDFFKDEFIDTQMIQTEMDKDFLVKKGKPCLVIRPKVSFDDDGYFGRLPDWMSTNFFVYKKLRNSYRPVLKDDENQLYMYCCGDRVKITFDIEILVETKMKQLNTAFYLKSSVRHKSYFYLKGMRLQAELPKYQMKQLSVILNKDLTNPEERTDFNDYLISHSQNFIEEKTKLSSGNNSHFYLYGANLLCMFENNPDMDDGESQGMTLNNFKINETLTVEFWCPNTYFLEIGRKFTIVDPKDYNFIEEMDEKITVHYTMSFPIKEHYKGMDYYKQTMYITDDEIENFDSLEIGSLFNKRDRKAINYAVDNKLLKNEELFHINLYLDKYKVEDRFVDIDWDKLELKHLNPHINDCYTLVIYKNQDLYNRITKILDTLEGKDYN